MTTDVNETEAERAKRLTANGGKVAAAAMAGVAAGAVASALLADTEPGRERQASPAARDPFDDLVPPTPAPAAHATPAGATPTTDAPTTDAPTIIANAGAPTVADPIEPAATTPRSEEPVAVTTDAPMPPRVTAEPPTSAPSSPPADAPTPADDTVVLPDPATAEEEPVLVVEEPVLVVEPAIDEPLPTAGPEPMAEPAPLDDPTMAAAPTAPDAPMDPLGPEPVEMNDDLSGLTPPIGIEPVVGRGPRGGGHGGDGGHGGHGGDGGHGMAPGIGIEGGAGMGPGHPSDPATDGVAMVPPTIEPVTIQGGPVTPTPPADEVPTDEVLGTPPAGIEPAAAAPTANDPDLITGSGSVPLPPPLITIEVFDGPPVGGIQDPQVAIDLLSKAMMAVQERVELFSGLDMRDIDNDDKIELWRALKQLNPTLTGGPRQLQGAVDNNWTLEKVADWFDVDIQALALSVNLENNGNLNMQEFAQHMASSHMTVDPELMSMAIDGYQIQISSDGHVVFMDSNGPEGAFQSLSIDVTELGTGGDLTGWSFLFPQDDGSEIDAESLKAFAELIENSINDTF